MLVYGKPRPDGLHFDDHITVNIRKDKKESPHNPL